jgi:hypothetical protein
MVVIIGEGPKVRHMAESMAGYMAGGTASCIVGRMAVVQVVGFASP